MAEVDSDMEEVDGDTVPEEGDPAKEDGVRERPSVFADICTD